MCTCMCGGYVGMCVICEMWCVMIHVCVIQYFQRLAGSREMEVQELQVQLAEARDEAHRMRTVLTTSAHTIQTALQVDLHHTHTHTHTAHTLIHSTCSIPVYVLHQCCTVRTGARLGNVVG